MKTKLRVLNVEDNLADAELNKAMLSARWPDCELVRVETCEEFIAALEQGGFDVILSDYTIPGFDGRQALTLAREKRPEVPFLFVSGTIGEDTAIEALKNGATDYVLKHRPMRLIPAVDRALREVEEQAEKARAEEFMRQSEYKYRQLFDCLNAAAFVADEQAQKIIDTNRRAEAMLGCSRANILGRKLSEFLVLNKTTSKFGAACPGDQTLIIVEGTMTPPAGDAISIIARANQLLLHGRPFVLWLCYSPERG